MRFCNVLDFSRKSSLAAAERISLVTLGLKPQIRAVRDLQGRGRSLGVIALLAEQP